MLNINLVGRIWRLAEAAAKRGCNIDACKLVTVQAAPNREAMEPRNAGELISQPGIHIPGACVEEVRADAGAAD